MEKEEFSRICREEGLNDAVIEMLWNDPRQQENQPMSPVIVRYCASKLVEKIERVEWALEYERWKDRSSS